MAADVQKALHYQLVNTAGVSALVSSRVYPVVLPQTVTLPAIVYLFMAGGIINLHGEASILPSPRVQIAAWSNLFEDCVAIDAAVKAALDGYRGTWGTGSYLTTIERCVAVATPVDYRDPATQLFYRARDYFVMVKE